MRYTMLLFSVLELLLFGYTAGLSRTVRRLSDENASPGARIPRAVLGETLEATTIPNHLQEDDRDSRFSPFTSTMTITTKDFKTTGKTNQLQPLWVTTTAAFLTKTMNPTSKGNQVKENSTRLNITVNPTSSSPITGTENTSPREVDTAKSSWTVKSTSKPLVTTEKGRFGSHSVLPFYWHEDLTWRVCKFVKCKLSKCAVHLERVILWEAGPSVSLNFFPSLSKTDFEGFTPAQAVLVCYIYYFIFVSRQHSDRISHCFFFIVTGSQSCLLLPQRISYNKPVPSLFRDTPLSQFSL